MNLSSQNAAPKGGTRPPDGFGWRRLEETRPEAGFHPIPRLAFLLCLCGGALALANETPAALRAEPAEVNFGLVAQQQVLEAKVTLTNAEKEPLTIYSVTADCGCTVAAVDRTSLAPGESTTLAIKVETRTQTGNVHRMVIVHATSGDLAVPVKMSVIPPALESESPTPHP